MLNKDLFTTEDAGEQQQSPLAVIVSPERSYAVSAAEQFNALAHEELQMLVDLPQIG